MPRANLTGAFFTSSLFRKLDAAWLFPEEKATLEAIGNK
jgi:hypothetical protein